MTPTAYVRTPFVRAAHRFRRAALPITLLIVVAACGSTATATELTLITHDSFDISPEVLDQFTSDTGITVEIVRSGDAGTMLNQAILTKGNPLGDVLFGLDSAFLSRALEEGIFRPYKSPLLADIPQDLHLDSENRALPVDFGDVCLNFDREALTDLPDSLEDLTDPKYRGQLVVQNPATSSPGLAFLLATIATFGEEGDYPWQDYWRDLIANDVLVTPGWEDAYYGRFSGGSGEGERPLVVSYASSPAAEVFFADPAHTTAPTGVIEAGCYRQIEFIGILEGTANVEGAQAFVDFMLDIEFQEDIPLRMFVFPANSKAQLPDVFTENATVSENPITLPMETIDTNRDRWIREWDAVMLP